MNTPLAVVTDYDSLVEALRQRAQYLDIAHSTIDEVAGLPDRYVSKLLAKKAPRHLGPICFGLLLQSLGVRLLLVHDPEAYARVESRLEKRYRKTRRSRPMASPPAGEKIAQCPVVPKLNARDSLVRG